MTLHRTLLPPGWPRPKGYSNGIVARGTTIWTGGVVGWDAGGRFPAGFSLQLRQCLENTVAVLAEASATPAHIVRMTWYVTDLDAYTRSLEEIGGMWRDLLGKNFPAMAVIGVGRLVEAEALIEIETTAVIPD